MNKIALLLALMVTTTAQAEIYRWLDENGVTVYSEMPPPDGGEQPATLAAELYAVTAGARYIRTHDVAALRDALVVAEAIAARS